VTDADGNSRRTVECRTTGNDTRRHWPTTPTRLPPAGFVLLVERFYQRPNADACGPWYEVRTGLDRSD
jgi:hypothetical protein